MRLQILQSVRKHLPAKTRIMQKLYNRLAGQINLLVSTPRKVPPKDISQQTKVTILTTFTKYSTDLLKCQNIQQKSSYNFRNVKPLGNSVSRVLIQNCSFLVGSGPSVLSIKIITTSLRNPVRPSVLKWLNEYDCLCSQLFGCFSSSY